MQVRDAMVSGENLITLPPSATVENAMRKMIERNVGSIIITQIKDKAIGIVTTQDIMAEFLRSGADGFETTLNNIMSVKLITIGETEPLNDAIEKLQEANTHHLLVTSEGGNLAGILSSFDIVRESSFVLKNNRK